MAANFFERLGSPKHILSPMVDQSELPFRLLARRYGAQLTYTPMINASQFIKNEAYRMTMLESVVVEDAPLIVQLAGHDSGVLLSAARYFEKDCAAVDLNLGCPQGIARRGHYGSFLLEEEDRVVEIVRTLNERMHVPVTCKIRLFRDDLQRTIRLCKRLEEVGCAMLTVHGRNRYQNKHTVGECSFEAIKAVKEAVRIPVIANGGIAVFADIQRCLDMTGADGVMSAEAALENPAIFCNNIDSQGEYIDQNRIAHEYLDLAESHLFREDLDAGKCPKCIKAHIFKILYNGLQSHHDLRERVQNACSSNQYRDVIRELECRGWEQPWFGQQRYCQARSWYFRHRLGQKEASCHHTDAIEEVHEDSGCHAESSAWDDCQWMGPLFD